MLNLSIYNPFSGLEAESPVSSDKLQLIQEKREGGTAKQRAEQKRRKEV